MFRVRRGEAGSRADTIVEIFVAHCEERTTGDPKHCVVYHRPFRGVTATHWKRAALKRHVFGWMIDRVVFEHVPGFGCGVYLVVELVGPGADDLLHVEAWYMF